jgi:macrolide transport system ATP-binding/permease protein
MGSIILFLKKLSILLGRRRFLNELDEEMAFHRTQAEKEYVDSGMTPQAARQAAMRQFGNLTKLREQSHEAVTFGIETVAQDLRFATRQLIRSPGFLITAITTLALGIAANVIVFGVLQALVLRPLDVPDAGHVACARQQWFQPLLLGGSRYP